MYHIDAIRALKDNYIWAISQSTKNYVAVVDPGEAAPVLAYLDEHSCSLAAILVTHHHWDHSDGIARLLDHFPDIPVYGSKADQKAEFNNIIKDSDHIELTFLHLTFKIIGIPGHTRGHVAYYCEKERMLFSGDTLFSCGSGRFFEGTAEQMYASLQALKALPGDTQLYCGHEYTLANIAFAQVVDPHNAQLEQRRLDVQENIDNHRPSLPVSMAIEKVILP